MIHEAIKNIVHTILIYHYRISYLPTILALKTIHSDIPKWSLLMLQSTILKSILPLIVKRDNIQIISGISHKLNFLKLSIFFLLFDLKIIMNSRYILTTKPLIMN